jgi:hypothetical protein
MLQNHHQQMQWQGQDVTINTKEGDFPKHPLQDLFHQD